jgi:hypothetical protein
VRTKEHRRAIQAVVFGGKDIRLTDAIPVERGIQDRLHEIPVREVIRPLALPLEPRHDGIVPQGFFPEP